MKQPEDNRTPDLLDGSITSTSLFRARTRALNARADIQELTTEIEHHRRMATKLRFRREAAKQRLARAEAAIERIAPRWIA